MPNVVSVIVVEDKLWIMVTFKVSSESEDDVQRHAASALWLSAIAIAGAQ